MLLAIETAARRICDFNPNISSLGKFRVARQTDRASLSANSNARSLVWSRMKTSSSPILQPTASGLQPKIRCAIYTRKSTDENLDSDFNSLDAQREACELYIQSQAREGWIALPDRYDDGAYSGATMERPALQRLITDIGAKRIDCVVTYKIDRLSRSLSDFTRLMEFFKLHDVTMVSVTQAFNTNTSSGVLFMNLLMTFASYEREVIAERIRDKVAASKKRGMWMGGVPPLGYDVDFEKKKLVVNDDEAELLRRIFERFLELKSGVKLIRELNDNGDRTKSWVTKKGKRREGRSFNLGHIYRILNNPIYIGLVKHKDRTHPGEHESIIDRATWDAVRERLQRHSLRDENGRTKTPAMLKGLIRCGHCGGAMGITYSRKGQRTYRYYLCVSAAKNGYEACPVRSVAAGDVEASVVMRLRRLFRESSDSIDSVDAETTAAALKKLDGLWDDLFPAERERIVRLLLESVTLRPDGLELAVRKDGLTALAMEMQAGDCRLEAGGEDNDAAFCKSDFSDLQSTASGLRPLLIHVPMRFKRKSGRKEIIPPPGGHSGEQHPAAVQKSLAISLARAHRWRDLLVGSRFHTISEFSETIGVDRAYIGRLLNLTLLAPDIVSAILDGREPSGLSLERLTRNTPMSWEEQRRRFGFSPRETESIGRMDRHADHSGLMA